MLLKKFLLFMLMLGCLPHVYNAFKLSQCISDNSCDVESYCFKPPNVSRGQCLQCWSCCMFPSTFMKCPSRCKCTNETTCSENIQCAKGMFCDELSKVCSPCTNKKNNKDGGYCPNRDGTEREAFFDMYSFYVVKRNIQSFIVQRSDILDWLNRQRIASKQIQDQLMNKFQFINGQLHYLNVSDILQTFTFQNTICINAKDTADNTTSQLPNCPCELSTNKGPGWECSAGFACSSRGYYGTTSMMFDDPLLHLLRASCIQCRPGEHCPNGTILLDETMNSFDQIKCPNGYYCPSPNVRIKCVNGTYCSSSFLQPLTCNYSQLLRNVWVPKRFDTVFERLFKYNDPYTGNTCRNNSYSPDVACPKGSYCPTPSQLYDCEKGYYCKEGSVYPKKCPRLSVCNKGASQPSHVFIPYLFTILVITLIVAFYIARTAIKIRAKRKSMFTPIVRERMNLSEEIHSGFIPIVPIEQLELCNVSAPWLSTNNAVFVPSSLNAIIGGSGCGKSTFLDLLRGNIPSGKITGVVKIKLRDQPLTCLDLEKIEKHQEWISFKKLKTFRGYVPQDDVLYGELTVYENLLFSSFLRLQNEHTNVKTLVEFVIEKLGLSQVRDKIVGNVERRGISGGQRKRVNIGMEVATLPSLLIMDEPTSGLDANGCQQFVNFCKILTHMNITIVAVVHQPRYTSFIMFDQITLLSRYGTVYEGPAASSLLYFNQGLSMDINKNENPADVLMDILSGSINIDAKELVSMWRDNGHVWLSQLNNVYPTNKCILPYDVSYDKKTRNIMDIAVNDNNEAINATFLQKLFSTFGIHVSYKNCIEFIRFAVKDGSERLTPTEFKRIVQEKCAQACVDHVYDNVIDRIRLFSNIPQKIKAGTAEKLDSARSVVLANKFSSRLLRLIGRKPEPRSLIQRYAMAGKLLENEMLLLSMACKHLYDEKRSLKEVISHGFFDNDAGHKCSRTAKIMSKIGFIDVFFIIKRKLIIMVRSPWPIQMLIPIAAAYIVGKIQGYDWTLTEYPNNIVSAMVCMGVLSMITHVRSFSLDKVVIKRETECNIGFLPYFVGYNIVDLVWVVLIPICFVIPYYYLTLPSASIIHFFGVSILICWWTSGFAYIISSLPLALHWANLIAVFVSVILGAFLQGMDPPIHDSKSSVQAALVHLSFNRWALEALTLGEYEHHDVHKPNIVWSRMDSIGLCGLDGTMLSGIDAERPSLRKISELVDVLGSRIGEQCAKYKYISYVWLFVYGIVFRVIGLAIFYYNVHPVWARFHWYVFNHLPKTLYHKCSNYLLYK